LNTIRRGGGKRHSKASLCQRDAFFLYLFLDQTVQKLENSSSPWKRGSRNNL